MPVSKVLDIDIPPTSAPHAELSTVHVVDSGAENADEAVTFVHFYATAAATLIEAYIGATGRD